jgi:hypothetical protein
MNNCIHCLVPRNRAPTIGPCILGYGEHCLNNAVCIAKFAEIVEPKDPWPKWIVLTRGESLFDRTLFQETARGHVEYTERTDKSRTQ